MSYVRPPTSSSPRASKEFSLMAPSTLPRTGSGSACDQIAAGVLRDRVDARRDAVRRVVDHVVKQRQDAREVVGGQGRHHGALELVLDRLGDRQVVDRLGNGSPIFFADSGSAARIL